MKEHPRTEVTILSYFKHTRSLVSRVFRDFLFLSFSGFFLHPRYLLTTFPVRACTSLNRLNRLADLEANRPISGHDKVVVLHSLSLSLSTFQEKVIRQWDSGSLAPAAALAAAATATLANKLPYESGESRSARYRSPFSILPRYIADHEITRIIYHRRERASAYRSLPLPAFPFPFLALPSSCISTSLPPFAAAPFEPIILLSECIRHNA